MQTKIKYRWCFNFCILSNCYNVIFFYKNCYIQYFKSSNVFGPRERGLPESGHGERVCKAIHINGGTKCKQNLIVCRIA